MSLLAWCAAGVLGGGGALLRFWVDGAVSRRRGGVFPSGTLAVNLSGAVALGLTTGLALSGTASVLVGSATIGAYTTFSTWMLETQRLVEAGELMPAVANILLSALAGLLAAAAGRFIGAHVL